MTEGTKKGDGRKLGANELNPMVHIFHQDIWRQVLNYYH